LDSNAFSASGSRAYHVTSIVVTSFQLQRYSTALNWLALTLIATVLASPLMLPMEWLQNEVNYFDLAFQHVRPDLFTENHAVRDGSQGRFFSFALIGGLINAVGFDMAKIALSLILTVALAAGYAWLALTLGLSVLEGALALAVFLLTPQSFLAHEWIFRGVEAKVMAYVAAFVCLGFAWRGRWLALALTGALATYLHFLVGGFWTMAALGLLGLTPRAAGGGWRPALQGFGLFTLATAPLVWILASERIGAPPADLTGVPGSLREIYAVFRNAHHVAPFLSAGDFAVNWMGGALLAAATAAIFGLAARRMTGTARILPLWLCALNLYVVLALGIAFLDRNSHIFASLYLFRPASLILLLSVIGAITLLRDATGQVWRDLALAAAAIVAAASLPEILVTAKNFAKTPRLTLTRDLDPATREMAAWVRASTAPDAVVLIEPGANRSWSDAMPPRLVLERLMQRPTLVNWKFVPTLDAELARWYRLLKMREAVFFDGECARLADTPVRYLVVFGALDGAPAAACGEAVWRNDGYAVLRVGDGAAR
jgi:hypothetical protein